MALNPNQQILELIKKSTYVLITCPQNWNIDCIASCLAWQKIIIKLNKKALVVCDSFQPSDKIQFLPQINHVKTNFSGLHKFIISLNLTQAKIAGISYKQENNQLNICITPSSGEFSSGDVNSRLANFDFDLILALNAPDLESLGQIYSQHVNFFYQVPLINIDHEATNENYGQINLVDLKAIAVSQTSFDLISSWGINLIDEEIATCLLAGLYDKTWGFRSNQITPQTLSAAAQLMDLGAKKEDVVHNFYQKKSFSTLKLWGRILANLQYHEESRLVFSKIYHQDFVQSGTTVSDINGIVEELISTAPHVEIILLFYEVNDRQIGCIVNSIGNLDLLNFFKKNQAKGTTRQVKFVLPDTSLPEAERKVIKELQTVLLN